MRGRCLAVAALAALTVGCGASAGPAAAPTSSSPTLTVGPPVPPVPGIEAEAVRQRLDEAAGGRVQVRLTDTGAESFTVTSVALDSPGFVAVPPREADTEFAPGHTIDLPVMYGEPVCDVAAEPAAARLTVVGPDGRSEELRVPLSAEILTRIHAEECAVLALAEVVEVEIVDVADEDAAVRGEIRLTRRGGDDPVRVDRVGRSVIIDVTADELPALLAADDDEVSTPVVFTSATCDPHALGGTQKPYVFPLSVTPGDGDPVILRLPVDDELRERLVALVDRVCLTG